MKCGMLTLSLIMRASSGLFALFVFWRVAFQNCFCAEYRLFGQILNRQSNEKQMRFLGENNYFLQAGIQ